jgi:aminomethyltransferase
VGLQVAGGDRVRVLNPEGRQPCELVVFNTNGESAPGILGVEARGDVDGIKAIFARMQGTAGDVLRRQNLKLDRAKLAPRGHRCGLTNRIRQRKSKFS